MTHRKKPIFAAFWPHIGAFILIDATMQTTKNRPRNARPVFQNSICDPEALR